LTCARNPLAECEKLIRMSHRLAPVGLFALTLFLSLLFSHATLARAVQTVPLASTVSQYDLSIKIVPASRRIEVAGSCRLPPLTKTTDQIEFYLSPKMQNLSVRILEPAVADGSVSLTSEDDGGDTKWILKTNQAISTGQAVLLQFSYVSKAEAAPQFNISPEGSFAGGGGELWYPQTSFSNRETGTLRFSAPAGETVISGGSLQSGAQEQAKGEFVFRVSQPSKFGFACGKYRVLKRNGRVPFALYLLGESEQAQAILDGCARALDFLTNLFGPFPYQQFSLVEVDFRSGVAGTSEYGFILADRSQIKRKFNLSYWAHELGHQWWGDLIRAAPKTTGQMLLTEGMAQFGGLLAVEHIEGEEAAESFRRHGLYSKDQSAEGYFRLALAGTEFPLASYIPKDQKEILLMHRLANSRGFILLDMLSREVGRESFTAILRSFVARKANQTAAWQDLRKAIEAGARTDVHWFFEQWFERTGAPDYQLSWTQAGRTVRGIIRQAEPSYRATLEVELKGADRNLLKVIKVVGGQTAFKFAAPFKVEAVVVDPHYKVLRWTPEFRRKDNP
jgi:hypothetical protein